MDLEVEGGRVVAQIQIRRWMLPDGSDTVESTFDDGSEDGETPAAVELLGMLTMTADTVMHGDIYDTGDDD